MFGMATDTRVEHRLANATVKIKLSNPSVLTIDIACSSLCAGWWRAIQTPVGTPSSAVSMSRCCLVSSSTMERLFGAVAPLCCARQPMGGCLARCFCAPPGVSGSDLVLMLATTRPGPGKVLSAIDFKATQLPCVVLCVFHYTKRGPAEHICIKLPMKQRLRKRCHFKNHLCIFIQSTMLTLWTHIQRTHTHTRIHKQAHTSSEGRKRLREPSVGRMKWRNEKMHQKSNSNVFQ